MFSACFKLFGCREFQYDGLLGLWQGTGEDVQGFCSFDLNEIGQKTVNPLNRQRTCIVRFIVHGQNDLGVKLL